MPDSPLETRWLKRALANLDAEADFIARDHPAASARVVEAIAHAVELLAQHPALAGCGKTVRNSPEATALIPGGDRFTSRGQRPRKAFPPGRRP